MQPQRPPDEVKEEAKMLLKIFVGSVVTMKVTSLVMEAVGWF